MRKPPLELGLRMTWHIWKNRLSGRKRFPIVMMLEPLETCNLTCKGCGRIREYRESVILKRMMVPVDKCLQMVEQADAPVVSIAGGEPLIHPEIDKIVSGIIEQKRFVFLCTNGLMMERAMEKIKPSKHFCWVVHLDGMRDTHDYWVERKGTWNKAIQALQRAIDAGYRVCTNTTVFKDSDLEDLHQLFRFLTDAGVEGMMVSAGYPYQSLPDRDIFLEREESIRTFRKALDPTRNFNFYNNPLYLSFLRGERDYPCRAWTNPTYTPLGWRKPCYLIADEHTQDLDELMEDQLWERYGVGMDDRCASCMMHSGFEAGIVQEALTNPTEFAGLVKGFLGESASGLKNGSRRAGAEVPGEHPAQHGVPGD
ncbi:MAG: adenosyl-hopene transferase HpnH [Anaerolineales bacterium]|jgi:hopanoid biosynthesis associated radical SAM protein HpnH